MSGFLTCMRPMHIVASRLDHCGIIRSYPYVSKRDRDTCCCCYRETSSISCSSNIKLIGDSIAYNSISFSATIMKGRFVSYYKQKSKILSPYELLNVSKTATAKEIKLAYFREAKKYHPDMNPNDPKAKEKFQQVAAAYELLSDEKRKRVYDSTGRAHETTYAGNQDWKNAYSAGGAASSEQHAEDIFDSVKEDFDVIKDAFQSYTEEIRDELQYAIDCTKKQDWEGLMEVAKTHKLLIAGVVVPTVLFLRYPPAVFFVLRAIWAMSNVALVGLLRSGNITMVARMLWKSIVKLSMEQKQRAQNRKKRGL